MTAWLKPPPAAHAALPFGRYAGPLAQLPLHVPTLRLKHWHFISLNAPDCFVGVGFVQLGYVAQLFAYTVDKASGRRDSFEELSPFGCALTMAPSPSAGRSRYRSRRARALVDADAHEGWKMQLELPLKAGWLVGEVTLPFGHGVSLVHDLGAGRTAYTYKVADVPASAALRVGGRPLPLDAARACADWTFSHARHHTRWNWASGTGLSRAGHALGLNLSQHVYDVGGHSQENVLWVDGSPEPVGPIRIQVPADPVRGEVLLVGDDTQLRFVADGVRRDETSLGPFASRFVQASGYFAGHVCGHEIERLYGLVEDHDAHW